MAKHSRIVGIDLGTTNSSIGYLRDGKPVLVNIDGSPLLPSVVGLSPSGELLVGMAARNQRHVYPDRTIRSVKRHMGEAITLSLGPDQRLTPVEVSALVFDVSIVRITGDLTEVLSSHGDTRLGGDDFDERLTRWLNTRFVESAGADIGGDLRARARLERAAERAKIELSSDALVRVVEEHMSMVAGTPKHLDVELARAEYEELIADLLDRTLDSVTIALDDAKVRAKDIDDVLLVGGSTRTPRVGALLHRRMGRMPRMDIDPDRAVALGATLHAARVGGEATSHILVDVTPFSFGTSHLGDVDGMPSIHAYTVILPRNTPLPCRRSEMFFTVEPGQEKIDVRIFQGESPDARDNVLIGEFMVEGLDERAPEGSRIVFDLSLDLDGILHVGVTEKHTGLRKAVTIRDAFRVLTEAEMQAARARLDAWMPNAALDEDADASEGAGPGVPREGERSTLPARRLHPEPPASLAAEHRPVWAGAIALFEKADRLMQRLQGADREEVSELANAVEAALAAADFERLKAECSALADVLFYLE